MLGPTWKPAAWLGEGGGIGKIVVAMDLFYRGYPHAIDMQLFDRCISCDHGWLVKGFMDGTGQLIHIVRFFDKCGRTHLHCCIHFFTV